MKIWVPKQREVQVTIFDANEPATHHLLPGELEVTDADGKQRTFSPSDFAERYEQIEKNSWPGYLKRKAGEVFMNGTLTVGFEGATLNDLITNMNAWAEKSENRHLILGDNGDRYFQSVDGRFYAIYYCYAATDHEAHEHLAEKEALEREIEARVKTEWADRAKQLGIDERNHLEKAEAARVVQEAIDRARMRELLKAEEDAKHCRNNHGKAAKGKK